MNNNNIECDLRVDKVQQVDTDDGRIMTATLEQIGINAPRIAKTLSLRDTNARLDQLEAIA